MPQQKVLGFELGVGSGFDVPFEVEVGFQQRHRLSKQELNSESFYRATVISAQVIVGTKRNPKADLKTIFVDDKNCADPFAKKKSIFHDSSKR